MTTTPIAPRTASPAPPLSPPLARVFWVLAALMLWLSLSMCFDAVVVFGYATVPAPADLAATAIRILEVSSRTPNFKVQFGNGATGWLSFPDRLGGNPKGGLKMSQITDAARKQLTGCLANVKVRSVPSSTGRTGQVWDLACPQAHLHYGPEVAASEVRQHPRLDLAFSLVFGAVFLCGAFALALVARTMGKQ